MTRYDPIEEQARRREIERAREEQRLLEQRQRRCRSIRAVMIEVENELTIRREELQDAKQRRRDLTRLRYSKPLPGNLSEIIAEQQEVGQKVDWLKVQISSLKNRIDTVRNDSNFNGCGEL